jgi:hypothetical protein
MLHISKLASSGPISLNLWTISRNLETQLSSGQNSRIMEESLSIENICDYGFKLETLVIVLQNCFQAN